MPTRFVGKWTVTTGKKVGPSGRLVITESGGTWKTFSQSRDDPCVGREARWKSVLLTQRPSNYLSGIPEAVQGCKDTQVELELIDAQRATGKRGD